MTSTKSDVCVSPRYSPEQVYNVVANISNYYQFIPWCKESVVLREQPGMCVAKLVVGFPPLVESYTSLVILRPYELVRVRLRERESCIANISVTYTQSDLRYQLVHPPPPPPLPPPPPPQSISTDGRLFNHLENLWQIRPGPQYPTGPSSIVNIKVSGRRYWWVVSHCCNVLCCRHSAFHTYLSFEALLVQWLLRDTTSVPNKAIGTYFIQAI